ncbi:hypothetical protein LRR18_17305, partial [Mangrovimonas sp. AS39]|uniref:hypothetical protein n=1 Tax=Mangrovimonas futianensis TaxID=2895523 RepID=UPI001E31287D
RLDKEGLSLVIYLDESHSTDILLPIRDLPIEHFLDAPIEVANEMEISEEFLVDNEDKEPFLAQEFNAIYLTTHIVMHEIFHEASLKYHLEDHNYPINKGN